jgi:hypothetical protein
MNISVSPYAVYEAIRTLKKRRRPDDTSHFPELRMGVGNDNATAGLQMRHSIAHHDRMCIGDSHRIKTIFAVDIKMIVGFKMHEVVFVCKSFRKRALAAAGKPAPTICECRRSTTNPKNSPTHCSR